MARIHDELLQARATLFEHQNQFEGTGLCREQRPAHQYNLKRAPAQIERYKTTSTQLGFYEQREIIISAGLHRGKQADAGTPRANPRRHQKTKSDFGKAISGLERLGHHPPPLAPPDSTHVPSSVVNSEEIAPPPVRIKVLENNCKTCRLKRPQLADAENKNSDLERHLQVQDTNLTYYETFVTRPALTRTRAQPQFQHQPDSASRPPYKDYNSFTR